MSAPTLSVIMLAYGAEEYLADAVDAVLSTVDVTFELVLVDNVTSSPVPGTLAGDPRVTVLTPGRNLGFAGGVNLGVRHARGEFLALVNSDAIIEPDTLVRLATHLEAHANVGAAGAVIVLADEPQTINIAGQPIHILGLSWADKMGQPVSSLPAVYEPVSAPGCTMVIRRNLWDELGGFDDAFFAYFEDTDLCWRARQLGFTMHVLSDVRVRHHYNFSRSPAKMFLLERNRWLLMLTCHEKRTLAVLFLPLIVFELAITLVAFLQGWGRQKLRAWWWIWTHFRWLRKRRARVQDARIVPDRNLLGLLSTSFDATQTPMPRAAAPLEHLLRGYWWVACRVLRVVHQRRDSQ
jgi:GT2 family glycosyltransferase